MPGEHNAENIKIAVEKLMNIYSFDKSRIHGDSSILIEIMFFLSLISFFLEAVVCDEGSSLLRLFKQIVFVENLDTEINHEYNYQNQIASDLFEPLQSSYYDDYDDDFDDAIVTIFNEAPMEARSTNETDPKNCIPIMDDVDKEIEEIRRDIESLKIKKRVTFNSSKIEHESSSSQAAFAITPATTQSQNNFDETYRKNTKPIESLEINFGTSDLPLFNCACHKLNIAIRKAISRHSFIKDMIKTLNSSNVETKRAISLNKIFADKKCRLRIENLTRWSSTYLMLEAVKRAYDRGAFDEAKPCPIEKDVVEVYLQILAPAYLVSIGFQSKHSSISDVLIAVRRLKYTLENMNVEREARAFCNILCECIDEKFEYEMNSPINKVR